MSNNESVKYKNLADADKKRFSSATVPVVVTVLAADVELAGEAAFIFRASRSGLEAAGAALPTLLPLPGLGSRLMTGMAELEAVGRGAARRLLRVVVVVEMVEEAGWVEVVAGGETGFSCSGAKWGQIDRKVRGQAGGCPSNQKAKNEA